MKLKNKTQITEEELVTILQFHNAVKEILESLSESFTCTLDEASKLQSLKYEVQGILEFAPKKGDQGPEFWRDYVLKTDKDAYFSDYRLEQMKENDFS